MLAPGSVRQMVATSGGDKQLDHSCTRASRRTGLEISPSTSWHPWKLRVLTFLAYVLAKNAMISPGSKYLAPLSNPSLAA